MRSLGMSDEVRSGVSPRCSGGGDRGVMIEVDGVEDMVGEGV